MLRRNVLIFHNAALGDFLMTWPVAMAVARTLAQSRILYITASHKGQLAERVIGVEYNDIENGWHTLFAEAPALAETPTRLLKSMQMAIVFSQARDDRFLANLQSFAGDMPLLHLSPNPPEGVHVWRHQLDQLAGAPVIASGVEQVQNLIRTRGLQTPPPSHPQRVVIHPGSGAERKNWPIERFIEAAVLLKKAGREVVFTLGEVERERFAGSAIESLKQAGTIKSCDTTLELYDALASAAGYLGNDSGPTHLASMLDRRVVALFGPTSNAPCWSPVGPRVQIAPFETPPAQVVDVLLSGEAVSN